MCAQAPHWVEVGGTKITDLSLQPSQSPASPCTLSLARTGREVYGLNYINTDCNLTCSLASFLHKANLAPLLEKLHCRVGKQTILQLLVREEKKAEQELLIRDPHFERKLHWILRKEGFSAELQVLFWQPYPAGAGPLPIVKIESSELKMNITTGIPRLQQCCEAVIKTNPEHISLNKPDWHRQLSMNCDFRNSRNDSKPREL